MEVDYVLLQDCPQQFDAATATPNVDERIAKYEKHNKFVRGHLLSHMGNSLFDLFINNKSAKSVWETLEKKYGTDDAGKKKYATGKWLQFKIVDDKPIMDQVHEYENLVADILAEGMKMCEVLQANVLIEKLPDSWSNYRNHLKHKKKDMSLEELVSHMKIEEANRLKDKDSSPYELSVKANIVESSFPKSDRFNKQNKNSGNFKKKNQNSKQLGVQGKKGGDFKKNGKSEKGSGGCYVCGKSGHKAWQCYNRKDVAGNGQKPDQTKNQAHIAEDTNEIIAAVISEINLVDNKTEWIVDTGATKHFCSDKELFAEFKEATGGEQVFMGNSSSSEVLGKGKILLKLNSGKSLSLQNVLYVPSLRRNLISGALLNKAGVKLVFEGDKLVLSRNGEFVGKGYLSGGLFILETVSVIDVMNKTTSSAYLLESVDLWHGRLGHVNYGSLKRLQTMSLIPNLNSNGHNKCEICVEAKHSRTHFRPVTSRQTELLELIHSDLADFKNTESRGGKRYYITFVDDHSRYTKVYLLRTKDEAEQKFLIYKAEVENQLDRKIKRFRSDRGGEYGTTFLKELCEQNGIIHELSAPYTPQQNGIAERKNRTLKEMMNAMLISSGLPDNMWGEAVLSANYVLNKVPHKKLDKTPYELWKGHGPNLKYLKVWGCLAKVGLPSFKRENIGPKTFDAVFVGYAENSAAYRFMCLSDRSMCESRDAEFFEHIFPLKNNVVSHNNSHDASHDVSNSVPSSSSIPSSSPIVQTDVVEPRKSKRRRTETSYGPDFLTVFLSELNNVDEIDELVVFLHLFDDEPKTFDEAMSSIDASFWKEAVNSEIESIMSNHTWELVELPKGSKAIGCKWIFKRKRKTDGAVDRYKARLVIKGFTQKFGVDFFYTYSPVTKIATIRALLALASSYKLIVHQMDVKTAFLNGDLEEEIYMVQPPGFVVPGQEHKVCKLKKSLYGLKQAPKQWYEKFHKTILSFGFIVNRADACVYSKMFGSDCVIVCLYVDDMLIFGTHIDAINETKRFLSSQFEMKDMGETDVILGVKVTKTSNGFSLSQSHYVEKVLKKFNSFDVVPVKTPYDASIHLKKNKGNSVSQSEYAKIIGSLMFLMNYTRPDIAYAVSRLSRYTHNPGRDHWNALRGLLKYLRGTMDWGLHYVGFPAVLEGYCDATGYLIMMR